LRLRSNPAYNMVRASLRLSRTRGALLRGRPSFIAFLASGGVVRRFRSRRRFSRYFGWLRL
jgi:hypothetical protein